MKQTILWTALPKGVSEDGSTLVLSLVATPRLDTEGPDLPLDAFPAFADWPAQPLTFLVQFDNQPAVAATRVSPDPDSTLWAALFPKDQTTVKTFGVPDFATRRIHSFPVEHVVAFLKKVYSATGVASPTDLPSIFELAQTGVTEVRTVDGDDREWWNLDAQRQGLLDTLFPTASPFAVSPGPPAPAIDFFRAKHFHAFRGGSYDDAVKVPELDFHEALALLGDHPFLLRRLGLIVDVSVGVAGQAAAGTVRVTQVTPGFGSASRFLTTRYTLDIANRRFLTAPAPGSDLADGMLALDSPDFTLQQVDVDGAALKLVDFANQLQMRLGGRLRSIDSPLDDGLPALRSGGVSVVRTGRAVQTSAGFSAVMQIDGAVQANSQPEITADQVTRGYRVDVRDDAGTWRSLCRRDVVYRVGRLAGPSAVIAPPAGEDEEGTVGASAKQDVDPTKTDLFLHESLLHWDGWSLVAPRPGETIQLDGEAHAEPLDPDGRTRNPSETTLDLEINAKPAVGSLPRLRFGRTYRVRARAVDIAGNSLPPAVPDATHATKPVTYQRFEPVEPPAVFIVSQQPLSNLSGESTQRPVIRTYNATPPEDGIPSLEIAERLILPPRTSVSMIEQYGRLDSPGGVDGSAATWNVLATKDAATVPDVISSPGTIPTEVPYLADPFATAVVLRGLPGTTGDSSWVTSFETGPSWWQGKPFRIAAVEGAGPPSWDAAARILTVELPKAHVAAVRLSSKFDAADLEKLALWTWIAEEAFDAEDVARLKQLAVDGLHWMLTPFRTITLVHAVQQPLASPAIDTLKPNKGAIGDTFAAIDGSVSVHAASTGKVDLFAAWTEPTGFGLARVAGRSHAFEVPVPSPSQTLVPWGSRRHEFGDTKHRHVHYHAVATTRFREYFESDLDPSELTRPRPEELPPASDAHVFEADVLSSARPLAPTLRYIVPTFGWESGADERGTFSRRIGGGLRVYLEEPWFSSGDGELLGVVMWAAPSDLCAAGVSQSLFPPPPPIVPDTLKPYVTAWGRDPIWLSGPTQQVPSLQNFGRAVATDVELTLDERPGTPVAVAGHAVGYDEDRQLFYCDLDIEAGASYYPFVRLALARYQPKSLVGAELSRIVVADFAQFAPDRMAWVARDATDPFRVRLTVSGTGYRGNRSFHCASELEARVERFLDEEEGDIGWVPVSPETVPVASTQALRTLTAWSTEITLPPHAPGTRLRIVIEEHEGFLGDVPNPDLHGDQFGQGRDRRLVYADAVEIAPEW